jgi:hypothetical protein
VLDVHVAIAGRRAWHNGTPPLSPKDSRALKSFHWPPRSLVACHTAAAQAAGKALAERADEHKVGIDPNHIEFFQAEAF